MSQTECKHFKKRLGFFCAKYEVYVIFKTVNVIIFKLILQPPPPHTHPRPKYTNDVCVCVCVCVCGVCVSLILATMAVLLLYSSMNCSG